MKIEEAIKQTKGFRTLKEKVLVNIHFTATSLANQHAGVLKDFGLSQQQYNVLRILNGRHPEAVTVKYLIERMMDKIQMLLGWSISWSKSTLSYGHRMKTTAVKWM